MMNKKFMIGNDFFLSSKIKIIFLIITVAVVTTFATTAYSGMASAQENKIASVQSQKVQNTTTNNTKVNVVLVHGAWADGSSWSKVIPILEKAGHRVIAVQLPLHSLTDDVATVKRAIDVIGGPVILVGHSYGGMVITNAAYNNPSVKGLVFIAALAPKEGQSLNNFVDIKKFPKGLLITDSGGFLYLNPLKFHDTFAQDVNLTQANIAAAVQKPFNQLIFSEKSGPPVWKQIHSWYQISENDHALPPALEHQFAKQINATTISIPSGHASLISHPNEVAQLIRDAAKGVTK
jgi:pimeloyl-ACP methyl ester carboxylesterase